MQALIEQMQALIEWIFRNLNSGDPVSDLYTRIIFVGALLALVLEIFSIIQYCSIGCKETQEGIKYLKRNKSEIKLNLPSDTKIGGWLQRHFLIQNEQLIKDENDPQKFLILSAPSILSQPVPRGPVYFAPTLLTALGVLGTFAGIYLGLQKINLNNISEATNLLEASTQLMEGMKLAFVTSLFGLGTSSFFMLFLEAFELSAEKAADTFKGIRLDFEEELQKFRNEYQESLNNFFTEQNQLLQETLGQQRDGLAQVVDSLKTVFIEDSQHMSEEIQTSMKTIKGTVEDVSKLSNILGLTSGERLAQLQELARTIGDEANQVSSDYQNMATQFNAALQAGNQQLAGYLQQANEVYNNRIQEFDTAMTTICQQLNSTSHQFMGVAQYLVSAANDLRNTNGKN